MQQFRLKIPASSANLGPGFDSLAVALNLFNEFEIQLIDHGYKISIQGFHTNETLDPNKNKIVQIYKHTCKKYQWAEQAFQINCINAIPFDGGLGSSATAIIAGILIARIINRASLEYQEVLTDAYQHESHLDNLGAAYCGGFIVGFMAEKPYIIKTEIQKDLQCIIIHPSQKVSTLESRKTLPKTISIDDTIFSLSRAAYITAAFNQGKFEDFSEALKDKIHEPIRMKKEMYFNDLKMKIQSKEFYGWAISGSGPSVIMFCQTFTPFLKKNISEHFQKIQIDYILYELKIDNLGTQIENIN